MKWHWFGVSVAGLLLVSSCTGAQSPDPMEGLATRGEPLAGSSAPSTQPDPIAVQRLLSVDPAELPALQTRLPARLPRAGARLPSLLVDPPGTALLTYHPPESWQEAVEGWASEDVLFYGSDGRWRRLRMEDMGLPESSWLGPDTYGAGELSPDGQWWASKSGEGVILVNLRTGQHRLVKLPLPRVAAVMWLPDSESLVAFYGRGHAKYTVEVTVARLDLSRVPYQLYQVGFQPDGTAVSLERTPAGRARLVAWEDAQKVSRGSVPNRLVLNMSPTPVLATSGRFAVLASPRNKFERVDVVVVASSTREVQAVLRTTPTDVDVHYLEAWLDGETLLLQTADHLLAWRPSEQRLYRVTDARPSAPNNYWSVSVAATPTI